MDKLHLSRWGPPGSARVREERERSPTSRAARPPVASVLSASGLRADPELPIPSLPCPHLPAGPGEGMLGPAGMRGPLGQALVNPALWPERWRLETAEQFHVVVSGMNDFRSNK